MPRRARALRGASGGRVTTLARPARGQGRASRARPRLARPALLGGALALTLTGCYRGDFFARTCRDGEVCTTSTEVELDTITNTTMGTGGPDTDGPEVDPVAFRINELSLVDPHVYGPIPPPCADLTELLNTLVLSEAAADLDNSVVGVFDDYDPNGGSLIRVYSAACDGAVPMTCSPKGSAELLDSLVRPAGSCREIDSATVSAPNLEALHDPEPPCVSTAPTTFVLPLKIAGLEVLLQDGQLASRPEPLDDPALFLDGLLWGFLPQDVASGLTFEFEGLQTDLWSLIAGGGGCSPADMMISDVDEHVINGAPTTGVWFYINFSAERVTWDPDPEGGTESDTSATSTTSATGETTGETTSQTTSESATTSMTTPMTSTSTTANETDTATEGTSGTTNATSTSTGSTGSSSGPTSGPTSGTSTSTSTSTTGTTG